MGNFYSYMRISTDTGKQSFGRQSKALERYASEHGIEYLVQFKEEKSGKNFTDRKEFQKLDKILQSGDTIVMKDLSRFTREAENGYRKYMQWLERGVQVIFIDNPICCSSYIKQLMRTANDMDLVTKTALESTIKLLLIVELDRTERERLTTVKRIKDGIKASPKKSGRPVGHLDKLTPELAEDIRIFLSDRSVTQTSLMKKHGISRNTLKKYIAIMQGKEK